MVKNVVPLKDYRSPLPEVIKPKELAKSANYHSPSMLRAVQYETPAVLRRGYELRSVNLTRRQPSGTTKRLWCRKLPRTFKTPSAMPVSNFPYRWSTIASAIGRGSTRSTVRG